MIDLHCHSTASDGTVSPCDLPRLASTMGIHAIALTDHDTIAGLEPFEEAAKEATNPALSESARKKAETVAIDKRQAALEAARGAEDAVGFVMINQTLSARAVRFIPGPDFPAPFLSTSGAPACNI